MPQQLAITPHGFVWEGLTVLRTASLKTKMGSYLALTLKRGKHAYEVTITPMGTKVQIRKARP